MLTVDNVKNENPGSTLSSQKVEMATQNIPLAPPLPKGKECDCKCGGILHTIDLYNRTIQPLDEKCTNTISCKDGSCLKKCPRCNQIYRDCLTICHDMICEDIEKWKQQHPKSAIYVKMMVHKSESKTMPLNTYIISAVKINDQWACLFNGMNRKQFVASTPDEAAKKLALDFKSHHPVYFRFENIKTGKMYSYKCVVGVVSEWLEEDPYEISEIKIGDKKITLSNNVFTANNPNAAAYKLVDDISSTKPMYFRFLDRNRNSYNYKYVNGVLTENRD